MYLLTNFNFNFNAIGQFGIALDC